MAKRIQRERTKGWRMPEGAVYVGRHTKWGNPFKVGEDASWADTRPPEYRRAIVHTCPQTLGEVVENYRTFVSFYLSINDGRYNSTDIRMLRGKDLACWCPLDQPCHADILLEMANG